MFIDQAEKNGVAFPISKGCPDWQELEGEYHTKVFTGELTAEEGCTELAKAMNEVLAKEKGE